MAVFQRAVAFALCVFMLAGCSGKEDPAHRFSGADPLKIGVMAGPEAELMKVAQAKLEKDTGLKSELVEFQDYVTPNLVLAHGTIDVNAFQHKPYLDRMVYERGLKLVPVGKTFVYPLMAYSHKIKSLDELRDHAEIAIPGDDSNRGRALILLDHVGLIKLKNNRKLNATVNDIASNPKFLEFVELEAQQLPHALRHVDLGFVNGTYAAAAKLTSDMAVLVEGKDSPYVNLIVASEGHENDPRIAVLVAAYQSREVEEKASELYGDKAIKGWYDLDE